MKDPVKLSKSFKSQAIRSIIAILFFAISYVVILIAAILLTIGCIYGGIMLILLRPMFLTIALGIGLASLGVMVLFFLIKFIFNSDKADYSHLIEIKKDEEPKLFEMIDEIVKKVETNFPKKVFLSGDVNASVSYSSNFWSMFLPVRKNLQIGVGLINAVSRDELKAILSHEFGHFSQRSMKVGSYVYNVNQIIFNMLYDNDSYQKKIESWANISGYFSIFVAIALHLVNGIHRIMGLLYGIVNKSYMGLSREMEFHADEIASTVTGYEPLQTSLLRLSLADHAYTEVINFYENRIKENIKSENIFLEQKYVMLAIAAAENVEVKNGLPQVSLGKLTSFDQSKLVVKDQWASHPSTEERISKLEQTNNKAEQISTELAETLFSNFKTSCEQITKNAFSKVVYEFPAKALSHEEFKQEYDKLVSDNSLPEVYNGYYDNKSPGVFDLKNVSKNSATKTLEELYSKEKVDLVRRSNAMQNDIEMLQQIAEKVVNVKTFDYDGKKYKRKQSKQVIELIQAELLKVKEEIKNNDIEIYQTFKRMEANEATVGQLDKMYEGLLELNESLDQKFLIHQELTESLQFIHENTPHELIKVKMLEVESKEKKLIAEIEAMMEDERFTKSIHPESKAAFEHYLSRSWTYFGHQTYFDKNLEVLFSAIHHYPMVLSQSFFQYRKELLSYQEKLIK